MRGLMKVFSDSLVILKEWETITKRLYMEERAGSLLVGRPGKDVVG